MENNWLQIDSDFHIREVGNQMGKLPRGIYVLKQDPRTGELYLTQMSEKFDLPAKIYGVERSFVDRVKKTYANTTGNLGILMNGTKGTGKTVTAKQIANELGLPIIIIKDDFPNAPGFINALWENVVLFFDEYEKIYQDSSTSILTVMDGVLSNEYRKVFLLTTNNAWVNENMLQRPGRIRYLKEFSDLSAESVIEIIDDLLIHKEYKGELIKFISNLELVTIDVVTSIVNEVNIHNESPEKFKDVFNVETMEDAFDVYVLLDGKERLLYTRVDIDPCKPLKSNIGKNFRISNRIVGKIVDTIKDRGFKVETVGDPAIIDIAMEENGVAPEFDLDRDELEFLRPGKSDTEEEKPKKVITSFFFERNQAIHKVFSSYAF